MKRSDPEWELPSEIEIPKLHLYNSLTRKKEKFVPKKQIVTWYSCGPTTYDDSHMGHARSYISFDILRRILQDYFGYPVLYVMNITDVDDKIIKRARTNYLFQEYKKNMPPEAQVFDDLSAAFILHEEKISSTVDVDKRNLLAKDFDKAMNAVNQLKLAKNSKNEAAVNKALKDLMEDVESVLGEWLDSVKGTEISDNSIFTLLPRHFEEEFNKDMEALNVLPADVVTRVSEFVPQIVKFVERIIDNGFAYESNGSVYFDVSKFDSQPNHYYAKLVPEAYGNQGALEEGEGALSLDRSSDKHNPNDFALWKASKPGEPWWDSPWGKGRPGWHIECSAMAGEIVGESLDIHTGGVDLKFPHHDNEIAQSEAYYGCRQWKINSVDEAVEVFSTSLLSTGFASVPHATGCPHGGQVPWWSTECQVALREKRRAYTRYRRHPHQENLVTFRQARARFRYVFKQARQASWWGFVSTLPSRSPYDCWREASQKEGKFVPDVPPILQVNYFLHTGHLHIDGCKMSKSLKNFITIKKALEEYSAAQLRLAFLLHSWKDTLDYSSNTMEGAKQYLKMVSEFSLNVDDIIRRLGVCTTLWSEAEKKLNASYDKTKVSVHSSLCDNVDTRSALDAIRDLITESNKYMNSSSKINSQLLTNVKSYVNRMFQIFGVVLRESDESGKSEEKVLALAGVVGEVRESLRSLAKEKEVDATSLQKRQLALCDQIRDELLPPLGIRLEDRDQGAPSIKLVNPDDLRKELEEKQKQEEAKKAEKEKKKAEAASKKAAAQQQEVKEPSTMFRTEDYSAWTEEGLPTHDKEGKEITKSQVKRLTKMMEAQKKKFEKWKSLQTS